MKDTQVDQYIEGAAEFARPILTHLRKVVHEACPEVEEAMKWSRPAFLYRGKILGIMSAFKEHCSFGFWQPEVNRKLAAAGVPTDEASGSLGRLTSVKDLPPKKELLRYVREASSLLESPASQKPITRMTRKVANRPQLEMPSEFAAALKKDAAAARHYMAFAPSQQYEYLEWIVDAKRDETRQKRIATAIEWLAEGKQRHWKYQK